MAKKTKKVERQKAQLMKLVEPEFLSVVGLPANRTGFKVLRSANGGKDIIPTRKRRKKRSDNSLLSIDLPFGVTEGEAADLMIQFGMSEDYELRTDEEGNYFLKRKESDDIQDIAPIDLGGGYTANVDAASFVARDAPAITGVTLVGLEMDGFETMEEVQGWLDSRGVNYKTDGIEMLEGGAIVTRHEVPEDNEVRKVRIAEGVTGLVSRTEKTDVPAMVYRSVIEQAYGNWGWGHLNFATALADPEFTDKSWDAIYILQSILENIIIYSGLPLDERKTLVQNATNDFTSYIVSLMDSLPRAVIKQASAERNAKPETHTMSQKDKDLKAKREDSAKTAEEDKIDKDAKTSNDEKVSRSEAKDTTTEGDEKTSEENTEDNPDYVTRGEMKDIVSEVMRDVLGGKEKGTTQDDDESDDPVIQAISAMRKDFKEKFETLKQEVDELGGSTVTRSDNDDTSEDEDNIRRNSGEESCFNGMFGSQLG